MQKGFPYIIIALLLLLIGLYFFFEVKTNKLESQLIELKSEKKNELKKVRDSASIKIDVIIDNSNKKFDSILALPPKIKYVPYEKPYYYNRNLDTALDIISKYKYNANPTTTN